MKTTIDMLTGDRRRYQDTVSYRGYIVPDVLPTRTKPGGPLDATRIERKLLVRLNPGAELPRRGEYGTIQAIIVRLRNLRWQGKGSETTPADIAAVVAILREEGLTRDLWWKLDERPGHYDCDYMDWFWKLRRVRNCAGKELFAALGDGQ